MLNALIATVLVFISVGLLLYLISLLFNAASLPLGGFFERQRFARYVARARRCDQLMQHGDTEQALRQLRAAFYLYAVSNRGLASSVANHHTALLSRLIAITSELQDGTVRLLSLAKTDRLLTERSELQPLLRGAPRCAALAGARDRTPVGRQQPRARSRAPPAGRRSRRRAPGAALSLKSRARARESCSWTNCPRRFLPSTTHEHDSRSPRIDSPESGW